MHYIVIVAALSTILAALKYHRYRLGKAYSEGYQRGYAMAYFAKQATPFVIRNDKGERVNVQVTDHHERNR